MTRFECATLLLQGLTLGVGAYVLWVYSRQLKTMQAQLASARDSATFDHVVALMGFLQTRDIRNARSRIIKRVKSKSYSKIPP